MVSLDTVYCLVLYRIVELNKGIAPLTYKRFLHILTLLGDPEMPVQDVAAENAQ